MNIDYPHFIPLEGSREDDDVYAALGRALTIATRYEINCTALALLLDPQFADDQFLESEKFTSWVKNFVERRKLHGKVRSIITRLGLEIAPEKVLTDAKNARNFVAHTLAKSVPDAIARGAHEACLDALPEKIYDIALGDCLVCELICIETDGFRLTSDALSRLPDQIVNWVVRN